jgi:hypothetical protein
MVLGCFRLTASKPGGRLRRERNRPRQTEGAIVFSERTIRLYGEHRPAAPEGSSAPTLPELLHEVEVAAQVGVPRDELALQLGLHSELFDALVGDAGVSLG